MTATPLGLIPGIPELLCQHLQALFVQEPDLERVWLSEQAAALIDSSAACFVPITVLLELEWLLRGAYKLPREAVIAAFEGLLAIRHLHLDQDDCVRQALEPHREGMDFAYALHSSVVKAAKPWPASIDRWQHWPYS